MEPYTRAQLLDQITRKQAILDNAQSQSEAAGARATLNALRKSLQAMDAPKPAPKPAAPAAAPKPAAPPPPAPAAPAPPPVAPVIADPVAPLPPVQQAIPQAAAQILAQVPPPPLPTMQDAINRVDPPPALTPEAQLDPKSVLAAAAKKKKFGPASTILTSQKGVPNLGSIGTRMLLG